MDELEKLSELITLLRRSGVLTFSGAVNGLDVTLEFAAEDEELAQPEDFEIDWSGVDLDSLVGTPEDPEDVN